MIRWEVWDEFCGQCGGNSDACWGFPLVAIVLVAALS